MSKKSKHKKAEPQSTIALNKKAKHDFFIEQRFEAGIVLQGWEVKSIRAGRVQLRDSYVKFRGDEVYLIGAHMSPLLSASTHIEPDPIRSRKLLLHKKQIERLVGDVEQKGYTLVCLAMYWKNNHVKCEIALAKGKKQHDVRATSKERDWQRQKERIFKSNT